MIGGDQDNDNGDKPDLGQIAEDLADIAEGMREGHVPSDREIEIIKDAGDSLREGGGDSGSGENDGDPYNH